MSESITFTPVHFRGKGRKRKDVDVFVSRQDAYLFKSGTLYRCLYEGKEYVMIADGNVVKGLTVLKWPSGGREEKRLLTLRGYGRRIRMHHYYLPLRFGEWEYTGLSSGILQQISDPNNVHIMSETQADILFGIMSAGQEGTGK